MSFEFDEEAPWSDQTGRKSTVPGRREFAQVVASHIELCKAGQPSTVFGLIGPWGTGKSRLLNEITDKLTGWKVVEFSPWSASDAASLIREFIAVLSSAFPEKSPAYKALGTYARFGTPGLAVIPFWGVAFEKLASNAWAKYDQAQSWHTTFSKITQQTLHMQVRVLVVIDDVDRLEEEELRALLKVVRLLGRFNNVHYILAYDDDTVRRTINDVGQTASSFLEKIVQHPFEMPPVPLVERRRWSREIVNLHTYSPVKADSVTADSQNYLIQFLAHALETPRAAERLKHQLASTRNLATTAELFGPDFVVITWIRINHHALWDDIRLNSSRYIDWGAEDAAASATAQDQRVLELVPGSNSAAASALVKILFDGTSSKPEDAESNRLRNPLYVSRYFDLNIADDDVSKYRVGRAVDALRAGNTNDTDLIYLKDCILGGDLDRALLALDFARQMTFAEETGSRDQVAYVQYLHDIIFYRQNRDVNLWSSIDKWFADEIYRALKSGAVASSDLISMVGYGHVISSAYWARRINTEDKERVNELYLAVAKEWFRAIDNETLDDLLLRPELYDVASLANSLQGREEHEGFLGRRVKSTEDLIRVGTRFVYVNEWKGEGTRYEAQFNSIDFLYAVSSDVIIKYQHFALEALVDLDPREKLNSTYPSVEDLREVAIQGIARFALSR